MAASYVVVGSGVLIALPPLVSGLVPLDAAPLVQGLAVGSSGVSLLLVLVRCPRHACLLMSTALCAVVGLLVPLTGATALLRGLAVALAPLTIPLAARTIVDRPGRGVRLMLLAGVLAGPVRSLFYDPLRDLACFPCLPSAFAVLPDLQRADLLALVGGILVVLGSLAAAAAERGRLLPRLLAVLLIVVAVTAVMAYQQPRGVSASAATESLLLALAGGVGRIGTLLLGRRRLRGLATTVAAHSPVDALRSALRDPSIEVYYPVAEEGVALVDADGVATRSPARPTTAIVVDDQQIALVAHDRPLSNPLDPNVLLLLAGARLRALLALRAAELTRSRARLVARADADARALESDLHDGAQPHLLGLGVELRLALSSAAAADHSVLEESLDDVQECISAVREISHGIYPALLSRAGLTPALTAVARRGAIGIGVLDLPSARASEVVERTIYLVVIDAALRSAEPVQVTGWLDGSTFDVTVVGSPPAADSLLYDRVAATGGTMQTTTDRVRVRIPFA
ncbi:MAG: hypothetical protein ABIS44_08030 [Mycobacteriales bacterium]